MILLTSTSECLLAADSSELDFSGLQLAWVKLPSESDTEPKKVLPKKTQPTVTHSPTPKKTTPQPVVQPQQVIQPTPTPTIKPPVKPLPPAEIEPPKPVKLQTVIVPAPPPVIVKREEVVRNEPHSPLKFEWFVGLGIDVGGDELGKVTYADGTTASVNANKGYVINVGAAIRNPRYQNFYTQLSLGYKLGGQWGSNGSVTWKSIPLEAIEFYQVGSMRMGLGLGYQLNPKLEVSIPSSNYTDTYNNAVGLIAQVGWAPVKGHYSADLRYTLVKFQSSDTSVNGNVAGLYVSYRM